MATVLAAVFGPLTAALAGLIVWKIQKLDSSNSSQHNQNSGTLSAIHRRVDYIAETVDEVKYDVRQLKRQNREQDKRLDELEEIL
jgi:uncharacterized protein HemX